MQNVFENSIKCMTGVKQCHKCDMLFFVDANDLVVQCPNNSACKFLWCIRCNKEHNRQNTCEEFVEWMRINRTVEYEANLWAEKNTRLCIYCQTPIEKNKGCDHMKCYNGKKDFNWSDAKPFLSSNGKK